MMGEDMGSAIGIYDIRAVKKVREADLSRTREALPKSRESPSI